MSQTTFFKNGETQINSGQQVVKYPFKDFDGLVNLETQVHIFSKLIEENEGPDKSGNCIV